MLRFKLQLWTLLVFVAGSLSVNAQNLDSRRSSNNNGFGLYGPYVTRPYLQNQNPLLQRYSYRGGYYRYNPPYVTYPNRQPSFAYSRYYYPYRYGYDNYLPYYSLFGPNISTLNLAERILSKENAKMPTGQNYLADSNGELNVGKNIKGERGNKVEALEKKVARIIVDAPTTNANVWFQGHLTQSKGLRREFYSPPLPVDQEFEYEIRVQWNDGRQNHNEVRKLRVRGGDEKVLKING